MFMSLHVWSLQSCSGAGGGTELWRPLQSLGLLSPSRGVRNILLLSDGHVQNQPLTLQLVRENSCHTRLFTCGLRSAFEEFNTNLFNTSIHFWTYSLCLCLSSLTANRHMLRALAQAGGGTCEFFDTKMKHTWAEKVNHAVYCIVVFIKKKGTLSVQHGPLWGLSSPDLLVISGARSGSAYGVSRLQISGSEVAAV